MLSDETRLRILFYLKRGERNVSAICSALKASQPTISHHLGLLRSTRLVLQRRSGKHIFYSLCEGLDLSGVMAQVLACRNAAVS
jgi:DNA-binding transcriptional ArsR family regulator